MQKTAAQHISKVTTPQKHRSFFGNKKEPAFFAPLIQPKLTVAPVNDPYETEADAVADKVMRMPATETLQAKSSPIIVQRKCEACEAEEKLHRKEDEELEHVQMKPLPGYTIQRQCAACEEEETVHRKEDNTSVPVRLKPVVGEAIQRQCAACEHEEQEINRKESSPSAAPGVTPAVQQSLNSQGRPLDHSTKRFMESRFGYDFGDVQIHNDSLAHQSSKDIKARAYTHGKHIVFGEGQYQPETYAGKQLLAHELTHVVQQNGSLSRKPVDDVIQRDYVYNPVFYSEDWENDPNVDIIEIDIKGQKNLQLQDEDADYLLYHFFGGGEAPVKIKYGDKSVGIIYIKCTIANIDIECDTNYLKYFIPLARLLPENCYPEFKAASSFFSARNQVIPIELDKLDTSAKQGSLVLNVEIDNNKISGRVGWLPGVDKNAVDPVLGYESADFSNSALLPFIYGNDYTGDNFKEDYYSNILKDGSLNVLSLGELSLPNLQKTQGIFQTGDGDKIWNTHLVTNIMGAEEHQLTIDRTERGFLSGEDDGLTLNADWKGKDFTASGSLHASFVNSNLFVIGKVHYENARGKGDLFLAVTDYLTAKQYAIDYLPDEIQDLARKDTLPPNANERLALVGAGNISLVLFDGNKEAKHPVKKDDAFIEREDKDEVKNIEPVTVQASFVVEPEGYITVAGEIEQPTGEYTLFDEREYKKALKLASITVAEILGPLPGSDFEFDIDISLEFGASIGPLTLSQLRAAGIYSTRRDAQNELELSGFVQLDASVFAALVLTLAAKVGLGPFSITILSKDITFSASMVGSVYARPTIKIRGSDNDKTKPRDYSITGNFDFSAAGNLSYQITDRIKAEAQKDEDDKTKTPETYKYLNSPEEGDKHIAGKDLVVPVDCSLGDEEPPAGVSVSNFKKMSFGDALKKIIKGKKDRKYFEKGNADTGGNEVIFSEDNKFHGGHYMEGGQTRGVLQEKVKPIISTKGAEKPTLVFAQGFKMMDKEHTLYLVVDMVKEDGKVKNATVNIEMASEIEPLDNKIEEEKEEIKRTFEQSDDFQQKDLMVIKQKEEEVKAELVVMAKNNELNEHTPVPQAMELTVPMQDYGTRYHQKDFGKPKRTHRQGNCLETPEGIFKGVDIIFYNPANHSVLSGVVIALENEPDVDGRNNWLITYKPTTGRKRTALKRRAYDDYCKPTYLLPKKNKECNVHFYPEPATVKEPPRYVNGQQYYGNGFIKPLAITAYPLCWSSYQKPKDRLVGMDRIKRGLNWHRTHLVDGKLGGEGIAANLVPTSKRINNDVIPDVYEDDLKDLVATGSQHKYYWFKAEVEYYRPEENYDIKHYDDFVKSIRISYGPAEPKDPAKGVKELGKFDWTLLEYDKFETTIDIGNEPAYKDIESTRTEG